MVIKTSFAASVDSPSRLRIDRMYSRWQMEDMEAAECRYKISNRIMDSIRDGGEEALEAGKGLLNLKAKCNIASRSTQKRVWGRTRIAM